ncbi:hypothetical protein AYO20_05855 [Fonsecaea nubica]|uniref:Xylanolytic transcriptional activator regulatory domain-containing protein n=1 Tax=Fonsecaea nubica TaxID=856822 RepID=A0A178D0F1_9EURO|nr:hypothetical protein AYO20_05855 [Fonsecaea nubica]OAL34894.1 hypothetical protein AYO20_05855 [Fonsecaea nubica]
MVPTPVGAGRSAARVSTVSDSTASDTATQESLSRRFQSTETRATLPSPAQSSHGPTREVEQAEQQPLQEMTIYKGEDLLTRFYGHSYHRNWYQQFDQLRPYIQRLKAQCPSINMLRDEIQVLKINGHRLEGRHSGGAADAPCDSDIKSLIPARELADGLIDMYITRFETTHRVFHIPSFIDKYHKYWINPQTTQTISAIQFLLAMATALSCREILGCELRIRAKDVISRETATAWIRACESWMSRETIRTPSHHLTMLATQCLLVIAKRANHIQANEAWTTTGALLRSAMAAGYHREPDSRAHISIFHREMRRRLWATAVELDLQATIERGMPPSLREEDFTSKPPLNIDDDAISESVQEPPTPSALDAPTDTSFQTLAYRSIGPRLRICALVNNSHHKPLEVLFDEAISLDEDITKALTTIPTDWASAPTRRDDWSTQRPVYIKYMLDMLLRQQLVLLHMPFANANRRTQPNRFGHSRRARLEAATSILNSFRLLVDQGIIHRSGCDNRQFHATMAICHELYLQNGVFGSIVTPLSPASNLAECYISMAESVLSMTETRITVLAKGLNEYYLLTMVLGLTKSRLWSDRAPSFSAEAVERITRVMIILGSMHRSKSTLTATATVTTTSSWHGPNAAAAAAAAAATGHGSVSEYVFPPE